MIRWLKNLWPFTLKRTTERFRAELAARERQVTQLQERVIIADAEAKSQRETRRHAEDSMTRMQAQFSREMVRNEEWGRIGRESLRIVERGRHKFCYAIAEPELSISEMVAMPIQYREITMQRIVVEMGMSEDSPPELVAEQIATQIKIAILSGWRNQSILLRK